MPIAVKLVQQNQESRSKAASGISQTKKCQNVGGICQKKTSACAGTYVSNLCSKSDKGVSCCANVRDTDECLNVGGRCVEKTATGSGTVKSGLCSKLNGSDIVCLVADGSTNQCTAMEGTCVSSTDKTSGGSCNAGSSSGFLNLKYTCGKNVTDSLCCLPSDDDINGECIAYSGEPLTAIPVGLCKSGLASWDGGDKLGTDGAINWKCKGFNDALTVDCSAKFKTIVDTKKCLNVGGRCKDKNKEATGSGSYRTDKPDLCSESNPGNVGCWVVTGSKNPCTAMGGECIGSAGVTTSGGSCSLSSQINGNYNLTYSCNVSSSACCLPSTGSFSGQCKSYGTQVQKSVPTSLCVSGTESWDGGDKIGNDGVLNWKCIGSNSGASVDCTAKFKVNGKCNAENSGDGKSAKTKLTQEQACTAGSLAWLNSGKPKNGYYTWKCKGFNGGSDVSCKVRYNSCGAKGGECVASKTVCTDSKRDVISDSGNFCTGTNPVCCKLSGVTTVDPTSVTLNDTVVSLKVGETKSLGFTVAPTTATDKTVVWSSSNETVATVNGDGVVEALAVGTATISVETVNDKTDSLTVTVSSSGNVVTVPVTGVSLSKTSLNLNVNGRDSLVATIAPTNATDISVTWTSDKTSVATVTDSGVITGVAAGTAKITVKTNDGEKTASATVTVSSSTINVPATGITLSPSNLDLKVGERQAFTFDISPTTATDKTVTWTSDKVAVATVSQTGVVTAVAPGTAKITVNTSNNKTATASVTVMGSMGLLTEPKISFKFSLRGITPNVASCFSNLGDLKVEVLNTTSRKYETGITTSFEALDGEKNAAGDQIFQVTDLALDSSKFSGTNSLNYVKIKGPFHLQARMCQNNQSGKLSDTTDCSISLTSGTVYNFSGYSLAPGDINQDGMVNGVDYSELKSNFGEEVDCGTNGDLNMDGVVNGVDASLLKESLASKDDE